MVVKINLTKLLHHPMTCAFNMKSGGLLCLQQVYQNPCRYGNAYYHAYILKKWPHFNPSLLVITSTILRHSTKVSFHHYLVSHLDDLHVHLSLYHLYLYDSTL